MLMEQQITLAIEKALKALGLPAVDFTIEHPADMANGDYAVNVALVTGGGRELAEKIVAKLGETNLKEIASEIKVAGPGFINISIRNDALINQINQLLSGKKKIEALKGQKVMVEFTDPNPFKEFHIGHLYTNIVGESICRLLEAVGANLKRANYQGDVGMHVAKSIWGLQKKLKIAKLTIKDLGDKPLVERIKFLGEAYALGATAFKEEKKAKKEITVLNKQIFKFSPEIEEIFSTGRQWSLEYFETIYHRLGTKFDYYYFEREVGEVGKKIVKENLKNDVFEIGEKGAIVFPGEKYGPPAGEAGLHTRVFINSLGLPTYEAKELGLAPTKYKDFAYDRSLVITANEINDYFKVLIAALKQVSPELGEKTEHLGHGVVRLPEGKMSSRTGDILRGEWLLDEAKKRVLTIMKDSELDKLEKEKAAETIGKGAVKYAFLKQGIGSDITFDFDTSLSFEGNSGPYLQYTYARCKSVLQKTSQQGSTLLALQGQSLQATESVVLRTLYRFEEVVSEAAEELSPNLVANFLHDLAQKYNSFYNKEPILKSTKEKKEFRLWLTHATAAIIKKGLYLLGIESPEKM
jgi:arginyl-tRNA synthetase